MKKSHNIGYIGLKVFFTLSLLVAMLVECNAARRTPEASEINTEALNIAVRSALGCAANYILTNSETNHLGLLAQPISKSKIVGYAGTTNIVTRYTKKEIEVRYTDEIRYSMKRVETPIYEYEYEEDKSLAVGALATKDDRGKLQKVTERRIIGKKQVGTKVEMKKVRDPKGDIVEKTTDLIRDPKGKIIKKEIKLELDPNGEVVKTTTRNIDPIYDDAPDIWTEGLVGQNAMVLLGLLKSGVPEDNHVMSQMVKSLDEYVCAYGSPDTTWDLAWLAAAFANIHDKEYERTRKILISKVLDGQITEGPARGLWGPVCVNTILLAAMIAHEENLANELANMNDLLKKSPDSKKYIKKVEEAEACLKDFKETYKDFTQQGLRFLKVTQNYTMTPPAHRHATLPGLPLYFYNQTLADMESTSLALYAIREAVINGCLPDETIVPMVSQVRESSKKLETGGLKRPEGGKSLKSRMSSIGVGMGIGGRKYPLIPCENTSVILARAASAISSQQKTDGTFSEMSIHQPNTTFEALGLSPIKQENLYNFDSSKTLLSTAQGYASLLNAGRGVGLDKLRRRYGNNLQAGREAQLSAAEAYLGKKEDVPIGRTMAPYDFLFALNGIQFSEGEVEEDNRALWNRLAYKIVKLQNPEGTWGEGMDYLGSSSVWQMKEADDKRNYEKAQEELPEDKRKPYDPATFRNKIRTQIQPHHQSTKETVSTAYAMLFLAEGVRPPVAGYIEGAEEGQATTVPATLKNSVEILRKQKEVPASLLCVSTNSPWADLQGLPVVFIDGKSNLSDKNIISALRSYFDRGGMAIVEVSDLASGREIETNLTSLVEGGRMSALTEEATFMADFKGARPSLRGIFRPTGEMVAVFLPLPSKGTPPSDAITIQQAIQTAYLLINDRIDENIFDDNYPSTLKDMPDPFATRLHALARLDAGPEFRGPVRVPTPAKAGEEKKKGVILPPTQTGTQQLRDDEVW